MQVKKQQLEPDTKQWISFKLGKKYVKAVHCYPAYLTYLQGTSCKILGWFNDKLGSRMPGEISTTWDMHMLSPLWQEAFWWYSLLMIVKEESQKTGLKFNMQRTKIMASGPITS